MAVCEFDVEQQLLSAMDEKARQFEEQRRALEGLAYRTLGTLDEAQDVVQETYLRWMSVDAEEIREPRAWMFRVCSRLALDVLKSARVRRTEYTGPWFPEPLVEEAVAPDEQLEIDESLSLSLLVALERLSPVERVAFLLHDIFGYPFGEVASTLGKSEAACRQLASRARAHIAEGEPRFDASAEEHRRLLEAFQVAVRDGREEPLRELLAESVELTTDGGGKASALKDVLCGAEAVGRFFRRVWAKMRPESFRPCHFNGTPGMLVLEGGTIVAAVCIGVTDGRIDRVWAHRNPDKLAAFEVG